MEFTVFVGFMMLMLFAVFTQFHMSHYTSS